MKKSIVLGYEITNDPSFIHNADTFPRALRQEIDKYHKLALSGNSTNIPILLAAIEKYPQNPQLKNYLAVLYFLSGNKNKFIETNNWIVAEHPDYLFGKLNLANEFYLNGDYEKIPAVLGEALDLKALYPHRNIFHLSEVTGFFKAAIMYFSAIGAIKQAEERMEILEQLEPDGANTQYAQVCMMQARIGSWKTSIEKKSARKNNV